MKTDTPTETEVIRAQFWPVWNLLKPQGMFRTAGETAAADHAAWIVFRHLKTHCPPPAPIVDARTHRTPATIAMTITIPPPPPVSPRQET